MGFNSKGQKVNLTNLWKASGKDVSYQPYNWIRKSGSEFIQVVTKELNTEPQSVLSTTRGRTGGTWAHKQIALVIKVNCINS
ncbi:KilA-N domain-containing protein [Sporomusa sphaeroides]|uniref:KilA-N domain-containing protein n=1 Tax=Sporomusa sphaeroides TaxID=47679 RepID=UPI003D7C18AB